MDFRPDNYVKLVAPNGDYRFGYVTETAEGKQHVTICMHEEGESKLAFDTLEARRVGEVPPHLQYELSPAEREFVSCIALGRSNRDIAHDLDLSEATVRTYVRNLRMRFGLQTRTQLAVYSKGLVESLEKAAPSSKSPDGILMKVRPHG